MLHRPPRVCREARVTLLFWTACALIGSCGDGAELPGNGPAADVGVGDSIASFDAPDTGSDATGDPSRDFAEDPDLESDDAPTDSAEDAGAERDADAGEHGVRTIGPSGGAIETDYARLLVPARALTRSVELRIEIDAPGLLPYPDGFDWASPMIGFFPEGQAFAVPVTIAIRAESPDPRMRIWWSSTTIAFWGPLDTAYEDEWAFGTVDHFSQGFVGRPLEAFCGDGVAEATEDCDGLDLRGLDCPDFDLLGVAASCDAGCTIDLSRCIDPCDGVSCGSPPEATCRTDVSVRYVSPSECLGGDCVWTEETEECDPGSCIDGACAATPGYGDILITEFLVDPDGEDATYEWFEIFNVAPRNLYIGGMVIEDDGSDRIVIPAGAWIGPASRLVLAASTSAAPEAAPLNWSPLGGFSLNSTDAIEIRYSDRLIDRVAYNLTWALTPGAAHALSSRTADADDNDSSDFWCSALDDYGVAPNLGTPGEANAPCAVCGDELVDAPEECDDGAREPGDGCDEFCRFEIDLCDGIVCDDPPPDECETHTTLRLWVGTCDPETAGCVYEPALVSCAAGRVCVFAECRIAIEVGAVVISEIMPIPIGGGPQEWFELSSFSRVPIDLSGVVVSGGSRAEGFTLPTGTILPASGTLVVGASEAAGGGVTSVIWTDHGTFDLGDSSDAIELSYGGERVHRVLYDTSWPIFLSASMEREETKPVEEFETMNGWCLPSALYDAAGNSGSPRDPSHDCPVCGNSVVEAGEDCDFGDTLPGDGCDEACQTE